WLNESYFGGRLPQAHIHWGITPHSGCLGYTANREQAPVIRLHPSLLGGTEKADPWGVPPAWLGAAYALDVLLHECIPVTVACNPGGSTGPTSHNCPCWVGEVNRLCPVLGFSGVVAGLSKTERVKDPDAPLTQTGKPATRVVRSTTGNVPFAAVSRFPGAL